MSQQTITDPGGPLSAPPQLSGTGDRDFSAEIDVLLAQLQDTPEDEGVLEQVAGIADEWAAADGLSRSPPEELDQRTALAAWLAQFAANQRIVHFGWRCPLVSEALASMGREVVSYLDHPARAIAASIRQTEGSITYKVLDEERDEVPTEAELVVIETVGLTPVVPLSSAQRFLRPGGWLAVVGAPVIPDTPNLLEAGTFLLDESGNVQPTRLSAEPTQLSLYRFGSTWISN